MHPALLSVAFQRTISPTAEKHTDVEIRKSYTKYMVKNKVGHAFCALWSHMCHEEQDKTAAEKKIPIWFFIAWLSTKVKQEIS
jgi:hypothetical protein